MTRLATIVALAAVAATLPAAGGGAASPQTLRIVTAEDVDSLDPALAASSVSLPIVSASCAQLFTLGTGDRPRPEVAAALPDITADGRQYTIAIRRGFRFSNGTPITGPNFAAAIGRVRALGTRSRGPFYVRHRPRQRSTAGARHPAAPRRGRPRVASCDAVGVPCSGGASGRPCRDRSASQAPVRTSSARGPSGVR